MGRVVNKSFEKVRKDISNKATKLLFFLEKNMDSLDDDIWTSKQNHTYDRLAAMCYDLSEEVDGLDEIEVPEFTRRKNHD